MMNFRKIAVGTLTALAMCMPSSAFAAYTVYYRCGDVRVAATWKRARDNAGVNGVWFSNLKNYPINIRNFKMRDVDEPPTLNGKPCKEVTEAEGMKWEW
jgi:hypothetical protein